MSNTTPMMRQWMAIKKDFSDCVILFRLGDFYEAFNEDAETLAEVCKVTLTSRPVKKGERVPMAGVPYHAVDGYIAQLVKAGVKVALVEQSGTESAPEKRARMSPNLSAAVESGTGPASDPGTEEPKPKRGIMEREVVRVVTPGTLVESDLLQSGKHHFLAALVTDGPAFGLAHLDLSTGEFRTVEYQGKTYRARLLDELSRLKPAELLLPEYEDGHPPASEDEETLDLIRAWAGSGELSDGVIMQHPIWRFEAGNAGRTLLEHFKVSELTAFGVEDGGPAMRAAGAALAYASHAQRGALAQIQPLSSYSLDDFMRLDSATRRNLELSQALRTGEKRGSLLAVLDQTKTGMGGRLLSAWLEAPLIGIEAIEARLDALSALTNSPGLLSDLRDMLRRLPDIERLGNRVVSGYAGPRELLRLIEGLERLPEVDALLRRLGEEQESGGLPEVLETSRPAAFPELCAEVRRALIDEPPATLGKPGLIRESYSEALDSVHRSVKDARVWMAELEGKERERSGIKGIKVGFNKVFGYYLGVPSSYSGEVPEDYIRKQTLKNAERYITPELKEKERLILSAEAEIIEIEREIFNALSRQAVAQMAEILDAAECVAQVDALASLAEVSLQKDYVRPVVDQSRDLEIVGGRHPVVEDLMQTERFTPNDLIIRDGEIILLTGPNMAGKSTVGRQVALIALLAQIGSFVPAERARIGLVDRIFTRIGAQDELTAGRSTFMVEMIETANILNHASPRSLVILDELGRGTSTYDGMAIAWAVLEALHDHPGLGCRTIFATHFHELTALDEILPKIRNHTMAVAETGGRIAFLHTVKEGAADRSYGVHVAELAGMPAAVTKRAKVILADLEEGRSTHAAPDPRSSESGAGQQLSLGLDGLSKDELEVLSKLRSASLDSLTPIEALNKLKTWQDQLES